MNCKRHITITDKTKIYLIYSICFWGFIIPKTYDMYKYGYAAFGGWDAVTQMYPVMIYVSKMIGRVLESMVIPMFELSLGMGDDLITALNWHGFGEPFYVLTAFVSESNLPYFYTFLFYLRVYLGGITFLWFVREHNKTRSVGAYIIGAFVYIFSGFTLQSNIHTIFVHAMIYIPLMLLGGERTLEGKQKGILTLSVFFFALSGFYYLYIGSITLGVYVIYRLMRMTGGLRDKFRKIFEMIVEYLLGLALAAFIFLPAVSGFLSSSRAHMQTKFEMFFSWGQIKAFLFNLFFPQSNYQVLSVAVIGVFVLMRILLEKGNAKEKVNIIALLVLAWIPAVSCVMSGFGEIYDRWELVIVLYIAFLTAEQWEKFDEINIAQGVVFAVLFCFLGLVGRKMDWWDTEQFRIVMLSYGVILAFLMAFFPISKKYGKKKLCSVLFLAAMVVLICKSWHCNSRDREVVEVRERNVVGELVEDEAVYRISNERTFTEPRNGQNIALIQNYYGVSEYFSIENPCFTNALLEWDVNPDSSSNHMNVGLDQRTVLETLSAVKYMVKRTESDVLVPYGYKEVKETKDGEWTLYENNNALPIFYTYDSVLADGEYDGKNGFEKQQIMLHTAAIENYEGSMIRVNSQTDELENHQYKILNIENGRMDGGFLHLDAGARLTLQVSLSVKGENYVSFEDIALNDSYSVEMPKEGRVKEVRITQDFYNGNAGVNLGAAETEGEQEIIVYFYGAESFPIDHLKIYSYDFSNFTECINQRKETPVEDIALTVNRLDCNVDAEGDRILCIAIPYSRGWNAYVDGQKVKIYQMNDMFMGIEVSAGEHHVEMKYCTYGFKTGMMISVLAAVIIVVYCGMFKLYLPHKRSISEK